MSAQRFALVPGQLDPHPKGELVRYAELEQVQAKLDKAKEENKRLWEELKRKEIAHHHYKKEVKP